MASRQKELSLLQLFRYEGGVRVQTSRAAPRCRPPARSQKNRRKISCKETLEVCHVSLTKAAKVPLTHPTDLSIELG
jgi:hypothetical protein